MGRTLPSAFCCLFSPVLPPVSVSLCSSWVFAALWPSLYALVAQSAVALVAALSRPLLRSPPLKRRRRVSWTRLRTMSTLLPDGVTRKRKIAKLLFEIKAFCSGRKVAIKDGRAKTRQIGRRNRYGLLASLGSITPSPYGYLQRMDFWLLAFVFVHYTPRSLRETKHTLFLSKK